MITKKVVEDLKLNQIRAVKCHTTAGLSLSPVYLVNIVLPSGLMSPPWEVIEGKITEDTDVLIGMDIIHNGDLIITNSNGKTEFAFQMPSDGDIEFYKRTPIIHVEQPPEIPKKKPGRNDPCPCGSGLKYKKCCGK